MKKTAAAIGSTSIHGGCYGDTVDNWAVCGKLDSFKEADVQK